MRIGLVVNHTREVAGRFAEQLIDVCVAHGLEVLGVVDGVVAGVPAWKDEPADLIVAVGGDGTVLEAVRRGLLDGLPVLGFNLGTIGFLAEVEPVDLESAVRKLATGAFRVEERLTLEALLPDGSTATGVNDVVVEKIESQRLVALALEVDRRPFLTYRADGVVVATSTGSTAYAFSAGGPLVDPAIDAVLVTPVAPHSLFDRTLVLPPASRISCVVTADRPCRVSVDGVELGTVSLGERVEIGRGEAAARFVVFDGGSFAEKVTDKFGLR